MESGVEIGVESGVKNGLGVKNGTNSARGDGQASGVVGVVSLVENCMVMEEYVRVQLDGEGNPGSKLEENIAQRKG